MPFEIIADIWSSHDLLDFKYLLPQELQMMRGIAFIVNRKLRAWNPIYASSTCKCTRNRFQGTDKLVLKHNNSEAFSFNSWKKFENPANLGILLMFLAQESSRSISLIFQVQESGEVNSLNI